MTAYVHGFPVLMVLLFWHCLADFPLQGDFLATAKNQTMPLPGVPWPVASYAHGMIHAGGVALATGSMALGAFELVVHIVIDYAKCEGLFGYAHGETAFLVDQLLHVACKVMWATAVAFGFNW